jgi:O-antigen biosynthesis protein WbqP
MYLKFKRGIDFVLAIVRLIVLAPLFLILVIVIKIDSKGLLLFKQKSVSINKTYFNIFKLRTMRIDTLKDTQTYKLENPEHYITKVGKFLRKTSLDELPQIFNIIFGKMVIIEARPALWNQYDLIEERDKYSANDIRPGLTGLAQIIGRDEFPIDIRAKIDGEYVKKMNFRMDCKYFLGNIKSVLKSDGIIEGGTGVKEKMGINI